VTGIKRSLAEVGATSNGAGGNLEARLAFEAAGTVSGALVGSAYRSRIDILDRPLLNQRATFRTGPALKWLMRGAWQLEEPVWIRAPPLYSEQPKAVSLNGRW